MFLSSAIDIESGQCVAVKKLARPFEQTAVHAKRAYREVKLMKLLSRFNTNVRYTKTYLPVFYT